MSWYNPFSWSNSSGEGKPIREKSAKMDSQRAKLSALIRGLQDAVQDSTAVAGQHYMHVMHHFFHRDGNKTVPNCVRIEVSPGHVMDLPLISLVRLPTYQLEEIDIDLSLKIVESEVKKAVMDLADEDSPKRASYSVEMSPKGGNGSRRSDHVNIKLKFKAHEPAEGYSRVLDSILNGMEAVSEGNACERRVCVLGENLGEIEHNTPTSSSSGDDESSESSE